MRYQEEKERRKAKSKEKKTEIKGIRLSLRIGQGDKEFRVKQSIKFLTNGDKIKIEMTLRGREKQHKDLAKEIVQKFIDEVAQEVELNVEQKISIQGGKVTAIIAKK